VDRRAELLKLVGEVCELVLEKFNDILLAFFVPQRGSMAHRYERKNISSLSFSRHLS